MVEPMPKPEKLPRLELDVERGADAAFPKSGSDSPSASSSMAGLSWRPRPSTGVWGGGNVVVCTGIGLNTDGMTPIILDAAVGLRACMGIE
jgi:hypothetical protein